MQGFNFNIESEDYIIYSRIAHYNDVFGAENTKTFYNLLSPDVSNDIYHYTELWAMALFRWINGQSLLMNYFFLVCPLMTYIIYLGFLELRITSQKRYALFATIFVLFIIFPYDLIPKFTNASLPIVGVGMTIFSLKNLMIIPIILLIFQSFERKQIDYFSISLSTFLYPNVMPVVLGSLIVYILLIEYDKLRKLFWPLVFAIYFVSYTLIIGSDGLGFSLDGFSDWRFLLKTIFIGLALPILFTIYSVFQLLEKDIIKKELLYFFVTVLIIACCLWLLFADNIDANQFFRNVFHSIFVLIIGLHLILMIKERQFKRLIFVSSLYLIPSTIIFAKTDFINNSDNLEIETLNLIPRNAKVLVLPDWIQNPSIYQYNEPMYNPLNTIFLEREDLNLINITSALPASSRINSFQSEHMLKIYRQNSPYFQMCGEIDLKSDCLIKFMKVNKIKYLVSSSTIFPDLESISNFKTYNLYKIEL
ncbi:hypothetical protein [Belliella baltica]|uniref:hypothetical protein n=1 Tax=Belliella baltica TaxID=232259 RepID=UPI001B7F8656|nr:hypothetical protein [Belliella baltica]